jgi:hypothetical protein
MVWLLLPALLSLLTLANAAVVRMFRRRQAGVGWWVTLSVAWLAGAAAGVWGGFFFEYRPSPRLRVLGAPVPAAFFHWEGPPGEEQWVGFITPAPLLSAASNVALLALLAGCPVGVVCWLAWRRPVPGEGGCSERGTATAERPRE